jgi:hypothetical protein
MKRIFGLRTGLLKRIFGPKKEELTEGLRKLHIKEFSYFAFLTKYY